MKVWNYVFIFLTVTILFWLAGIDIAGISGIMNTVGLTDESGSLRDSDGNLVMTYDNSFKTKILGIIGLIATAGIIMGLFARGRPENYIIAGILTGGLIALFGGWVYSIMIYAFSLQDWIGYITLVIIAPLGMGFLFSLIEFIRGTD